MVTKPKVRVKDSEYFSQRLKFAVPIGLFVLIGLLTWLIPALF